MDNFEDLLIEKHKQLNNDFRRPGEETVVDKIDMQPPIGLLKAEGTMDLFEFIKMVEKIVTIAMKDMHVKFIPEENRVPIDNPDMKINESYITYRIISQEPKDKDGLKPRIREEIYEDPKHTQESRMGQIYGQKFQSIIQFNIFSSVYAESEQVMKKFVELLFTYTGSLKKKGLGELIYKKQLTDTDLDQYRQTMSIRSIRYYVETENVFVVFRNKIEEINIFDS